MKDLRGLYINDRGEIVIIKMVVHLNSLLIGGGSIVILKYEALIENIPCALNQKEFEALDKIGGYEMIYPFR